MNLSGSKILKPKQKSEWFENNQCKSSMSLTARRFYDNKEKKKPMTEKGFYIFDRESLIKKLMIGNKKICRSFVTF